MAVLVAVEEILLAALPPATPRQAEHVRAAQSQSLLFGCSQSHVADAPAHVIVDRASAESAYRVLGRAEPSKPVEVAANAVLRERRISGESLTLSECVGLKSTVRRRSLDPSA